MRHQGPETEHCLDRTGRWWRAKLFGHVGYGHGHIYSGGLRIQLDHAYVIASNGAPEADRLVELGLTEGTPNTHAGQGTANRRFFFADFGLELIYVSDEEEAQNGPGHILRLIDRRDADDGSPLGLVFRATDEADARSFPGFPYQPLYFAEGQYFVVGSNVDVLTEPTCIVMPSNLPRRPLQDLSGQPFERITSVCVSTPATTMSPALALASQVDRVAIRTGRDHLLEVEFGNGAEAASCDLRPALPLALRW